MAGATARTVRQLAPTTVTFVITGRYPGSNGDEDVACADYLSALVSSETPDPAPYLARVRNSLPGRTFADPARPEFPSQDLAYATKLDRFNFAMLVERRDGLLVMRTVR